MNNDQFCMLLVQFIRTVATVCVWKMNARWLKSVDNIAYLKHNIMLEAQTKNSNLRKKPRTNAWTKQMYYNTTVIKKTTCQNDTLNRKHTRINRTKEVYENRVANSFFLSQKRIVSSLKNCVSVLVVTPCG